MTQNIELEKAALEKQIKLNPFDNSASQKLSAINAKLMNELYVDSKDYMARMINDGVRTRFYQKVISENCPNKRVLEIGTGIGLLCYIMSKNNVAKIATCDGDNANYETARRFFYDNGLENTVQNFNKSSFNLEIPKDVDNNYDIILHELYASDGLAENILETINNAKRFLKPEGKIIPGNFTVWFVPFTLPKSVDFFDTVTEMYPEADLHAWEYADFDYPHESKTFVAEPQMIFDIDLNSNFKMSDEITVDVPACHGVACFFVATEGEHELSQYAFSDKTHYAKDSWGLRYFQFIEPARAIRFEYNRSVLKAHPIT